MHAKNGVFITKVTHAAWPFATSTACAHGATVSGTKALGGWNDSGSYHNYYNQTFPINALLRVGMFNARKPEEHFLARDMVGKSSF